MDKNSIHIPELCLRLAVYNFHNYDSIINKTIKCIKIRYPTILKYAGETLDTQY